MTKTLTTLTAAAALAVALTAAPSDAFAQRRGAAIGLGILGGVAAGAIIGGAIAGQPRYYEPAPVYVAPAQRCYTDQEVWSNRRQAYVVRRVIVPCY